MTIGGRLECEANGKVGHDDRLWRKHPLTSAGRTMIIYCMCKISSFALVTAAKKMGSNSNQQRRCASAVVFYGSGCHTRGFEVSNVYLVRYHEANMLSAG